MCNNKAKTKTAEDKRSAEDKRRDKRSDRKIFIEDMFKEEKDYCINFTDCLIYLLWEKRKFESERSEYITHETELLKDKTVIEREKLKNKKFEYSIEENTAYLRSLDKRCNVHRQRLTFPLVVVFIEERTQYSIKFESPYEFNIYINILQALIEAVDEFWNHTVGKDKVSYNALSPTIHDGEALGFILSDTEEDDGSEQYAIKPNYSLEWEQKAYRSYLNRAIQFNPSIRLEHVWQGMRGVCDLKVKERRSALVSFDTFCYKYVVCIYVDNSCHNSKYSEEKMPMQTRKYIQMYKAMGLQNAVVCNYINEWKALDRRSDSDINYLLRLCQLTKQLTGSEDFLSTKSYYNKFSNEDINSLLSDVFKILLDAESEKVKENKNSNEEELFTSILNDDERVSIEEFIIKNKVKLFDTISIEECSKFLLSISETISEESITTIGNYKNYQQYCKAISYLDQKEHSIFWSVLETIKKKINALLKEEVA